MTLKVAASVVLLLAILATAATANATANTPAVRTIEISYRAHDGLLRRAYVILPGWYGPAHHPPIPLVISPQGRGVSAEENIRRWGHLPAVGRFAVINPEGQGRALTLFSWGDPGEIRDLARMPRIAEHALPWLHVDRRRIYAFGEAWAGRRRCCSWRATRTCSRVPRRSMPRRTWRLDTARSSTYRWGPRYSALLESRSGALP